MININVFFIFSFFGYIYESIVNYIQSGSFTSGFMYGIVTPIYGIGSLIIIYINSKTKNNKLLFFVFTMLFIGLIEFIGGNLLQLTFKKIYWNYSNLPLSIGKYVSIEICLCWGILGFLVVFIYDKIIKYIKKIPTYVTIICIILFLIDLIFSLIKLI